MSGEPADSTKTYVMSKTSINEKLDHLIGKLDDVDREMQIVKVEMKWHARIGGAIFGGIATGFWFLVNYLTQK